MARFETRTLADGQQIWIDTWWVCHIEVNPPLEPTQDYGITEQI